ncbi:hypothetical protein ACF1BE_33610 [Streptomyces sp. NPDC014991]|uniref:hypothetical protein n=1 Tax=Streptomyces sp. NPDC014991 TaxID=3364935 RepID=UPI0036F5F13B
MPASRSVTALTGVIVLGLTLAACQDQVSGQIAAWNGARLVETISNTSTHGCRRFREEVTRVVNYTQNSLLLYTTPDCTVPPGGASIYLDAQSSDEAVRSTGLWRSFSVAPE